MTNNPNSVRPVVLITLLATVVLSGLSLLTVRHCLTPQAQANTQANTRGLPADALDVHDEGNGWLTFSWHNRRFLYHSSTYAASQTISCCEISPDKKDPLGFSDPFHP